MNPMNLIDGPAAAVVLGGTLVATVLRSGFDDTRATLQALHGLFRPKFRADMARAELATQVAQIRQDGVYRAMPKHFGDREFDEATDALIATRSIAGLLERHEAHKGRRLAKSARAVGALAQAAELAPVFGLAGTLISLSQLPGDGVARGAWAGAISMAVLTTLYGLLLANLVLAPLARMVERQAQDEEAARQDVIDWLAWQVAPAIPESTPRGRPAHTGHRAAPHAPAPSPVPPMNQPLAPEPVASEPFAATRAEAATPEIPTEAAA